jgi:signal transduction histidine kinase
MGLFTLLLSVIALSLFGSLVTADRAMVASQRELAELDARAAALIAERDLKLRAERLAEFFDPLLPSGAPAAPRPPDGFAAVWVLDTSFRLAYVQRRPLSPPDSAAVVAIAAQASPTLWPAAAPATIASDSAAGILLAAPLTHRGERLGTAVGLVPVSNVLSALHDTASYRGSIAVRMVGGDASVGSPGIAARGAPDRRAEARIALPGEPLHLVVTRAEEGQGLRSLLWVLGVVALAALFTGLARERRQTDSLAARTAELERLYQEVARSNRMKSEFLANVSHELRTPLNAIVGFVEMLREGVYGDLTPRQALPVDRIAASATHLRQLVDRLLDIAKIAAGRLEVHPEPVMLRPFVLNVASEMESLVRESGLALSISMPPALPRIRTDPTHLRQILINLIGNAVKYTPAGGVTVRGEVVRAHPADAAAGNGAQGTARPPRNTGDWVALMVTDTGVGIAPEDQERIFDEFEQVNAGARTDSARRGTGLGLAISRRLARLLDGEITVVSNPGGGSTFTVWLPLEGEPEPEAAVDATPEARVRTSA